MQSGQRSGRCGRREFAPGLSSTPSTNPFAVGSRAVPGVEDRDRTRSKPSEQGHSDELASPELWMRIFDLSVDHGSEEHAKQVTPLTRVCWYWGMVFLHYPRIPFKVCMKPGNRSVVSEWLTPSHRFPLTVIAEFTDPMSTTFMPLLGSSHCDTRR